MSRRTRYATRTTTTPWGRPVTSVAPGAIDDLTLALFALPADATGPAVDAAPMDLFAEYHARTHPAPLVDMSPAPSTVPLVTVAPSVGLDPIPAPTGLTIDPAALDAVKVHLIDTPRDVRTSIRSGEVATGDVVAIVGERSTVAAVVVDGWPVAVGPDTGPWRALDTADGWAVLDGGRYVAAAQVAADVAVIEHRPAPVAA